jgi:hypothetical protein
LFKTKENKAKNSKRKKLRTMWQQDESHYGEKIIHHMWDYAQSRFVHNNQHNIQLFDVCACSTIYSPTINSNPQLLEVLLIPVVIGPMVVNPCSITTRLHAWCYTPCSTFFDTILTHGQNLVGGI